MSEQTKTTILQIQIDRTDANKALQDTEKNLLNLKNAQKDLNEQIKQGNITQDEYVQSKIKLDSQIRAETDSRKRLQQAIDSEDNSLSAQKALLSDLIAQREKLNTTTKEGQERFEVLTAKIKSLNDSLMNTKKESGGLTEAFLKFSENAKVGEFELGKIVDLLPKIASPALAAGSAIAVLGSAYASSAVGVKDLEEAQNRIKAQWEVFSGAIGGEIGEGEGLISTVTRYVTGIGKGFIAAVGDVLTFGQGGFIQAAEEEEKQVNKVADAYNKITELQFEQMRNEVIAAKQRQKAFELVQQREDRERSLNERLESANEIIRLQKESVENSVEALKQQAQQLVIIGELTNNNVLDPKNISPLAKQYNSILLQIAENESSRARRITQSELAAKNLTHEINKQNEEIRIQNNLQNEKIRIQNNLYNFNVQKGKNQTEEDEGKRIGGVKSDSALEVKINKSKFEAKALADIDAEYTKEVNNSSKLRQEEIKREQEYHDKAVQTKIRSDAAYLQASRQFGQAAKTILGENTSDYKAFSTAQAIIATYTGADKALASVPFPANIVAAAGVIAEGLANVVQINNAGFSEGGYTGAGSKYQPAGIVHAGEVVWSQNDVAAVGGPSVANAMRPTFKGYAEGGLVTSQMSNSVDKEMSMSNAFKNMPPATISWKEGLIVDARIKYKESLTSK